MITYIEYSIGNTKGATSAGKVTNSTFMLGDVDANYTSAQVVTEAKTATGTAGDYTATLKWRPIVTGSVEIINGNKTFVDNAGKLYLAADTTFTTQKGTIDYDTGDVKISEGEYNTSTTVFVNYVYNNVVIPQNELPTLKAEMKSIALVAKARRIAIYYSQMAAFQSKTDYGMDLGDQLAEKAVSELSYEIDTEVTNLLVTNATEPSDGTTVWSKTLPVGVSKRDHYCGFTEVLEIAKQKIYDATKKFTPNFMLIASDILPVLSMIDGFKANPAASVNGPYFAGTLSGLKVFVTPNITAGTFVVGVNGSDAMSAACVYAPYMAIVPTQLLQFADGGTSSGWSTLYDLKMLNPLLVVKGRVTA